jgi:hypothetical protein
LSPIGATTDPALYGTALTSSHIRAI